MPRSPLSVEVMAGSRSVLVRLAGEVDLATAPLVEEVLADLGIAAESLLVDLREVTLLDCSGVALLERLDRRCAAAGGELAVIAPRPGVAMVLALVGMNHLVAESAMSSLAATI